jgi:hypothetical protein
MFSVVFLSQASVSLIHDEATTVPVRIVLCGAISLFFLLQALVYGQKRLLMDKWL